MNQRAASGNHATQSLLDFVGAAAVAVAVLVFAVGAGTGVVSWALKDQLLDALGTGCFAALGFWIEWVALHSATRRLFVWVLSVGLGVEWVIGGVALLLQRATLDANALGFLLASLAVLLMLRVGSRSQRQR
jgi:hypothetical protein